MKPNAVKPGLVQDSLAWDGKRITSLEGMLSVTMAPIDGLPVLTLHDRHGSTDFKLPEATKLEEAHILAQAVALRIAPLNLSAGSRGWLGFTLSQK